MRVAIYFERDGAGEQMQEVSSCDTNVEVGKEGSVTCSTYTSYITNLSTRQAMVRPSSLGNNEHTQVWV